MKAEQVGSPAAGLGVHRLVSSGSASAVFTLQADSDWTTAPDRPRGYLCYLRSQCAQSLADDEPRRGRQGRERRTKKETKERSLILASPPR